MGTIANHIIPTMAQYGTERVHLAFSRPASGPEPGQAVRTGSQVPDFIDA